MNPIFRHRGHRGSTEATEPKPHCRGRRPRILRALGLLLCALCVPVWSGCTQWPKDSYIRGGKVQGLWGSVSVDAAATGAAARNLTAEERKEILQPKTAKPD